MYLASFFLILALLMHFQFYGLFFWAFAALSAISLIAEIDFRRSESKTRNQPKKPSAHEMRDHELRKHEAKTRNRYKKPHYTISDQHLPPTPWPKLNPDKCPQVASDPDSSMDGVREEDS